MNKSTWKKLPYVSMATLALLYPGCIEPKSPSYKVEFRGVDNHKQLRSLKRSSNLVRFRRRSTKSLASLKYRADQDIPEFLKVLRAYSFYDACVTARAFRQPNGQYKMVIGVDKGAPYYLQSFEYRGFDRQKNEIYNLNDIHLRELGLKLGKPAQSQGIVQAEKILIAKLNEHGYPFAKIEDQDIIVDQARKTVAVDVKIDEGPVAHFGEVNITGFKGIKEQFIRNRIAWKEGELFSSKKILETEKNLYDSGLFSIVNITYDQSLTSNKELPVNIELLDSKYNYITVGGSYTTTWEGFGGSASWQNRNIFRSGLNLRLNYNITQKRHQSGIKLLLPDFFSAKNKLVAESDVTWRNVMPNYQENGVVTNVYVERIFSEYFKMSLGTSFDQFSTTRSLNNGYFSLLGVPLFLNLQSSDKVLINPTQGGWLSLNFSPQFALNRGTSSFAEAKIEGSVYQYLIPSRRIILAGNVVLGTLFGSSLNNIPPTYRFYAGSPQHLRGYPFEKVSPLDAQGQETGGRSMLLMSIEPRFMILKSVALVGFYDVGNVYVEQWPKFKEGFVQSVGVGARYYSFVGPLRLDIGFPLNNRPNVKRDYQIYFSIGQAF